MVLTYVIFMLVQAYYPKLGCQWIYESDNCWFWSLTQRSRLGMGFKWESFNQSGRPVDLLQKCVVINDYLWGMGGTLTFLRTLKTIDLKCKCKKPICKCLTGHERIWKASIETHPKNTEKQGQFCILASCRRSK